MSSQTEDQISVGRAHARNVLEIIAAGHGEEVAHAMAAGLLAGVRDYFYDRLQRIADSCPQLSADSIEKEIKDVVRGLRRKA